LKEYFKVMTFQENAMPMSVDNRRWDTREQAEKHMEKMKQIINAPMYVSHIYDNRGADKK
jgi:hypothetical protein